MQFPGAPFANSPEISKCCFYSSVNGRHQYSSLVEKIDFFAACGEDILRLIPLLLNLFILHYIFLFYDVFLFVEIENPSTVRGKGGRRRAGLDCIKVRMVRSESFLPMIFISDRHWNRLMRKSSMPEPERESDRLGIT